MKKFFAGLLVVLSFVSLTPFAMAAVKKKTAVKPVVSKSSVSSQAVADAWQPVVHLSKKYPYVSRRATAECEDGVLSYLKKPRNICGAHGGVMLWFK